MSNLTKAETEDYGLMFRALAARFNTTSDMEHFRRVHQRWSREGKASRSPVYMIGAKYI